MDKPTRNQLENAAQQLTRNQQPGSENAVIESILTLAQADPNDPTVREFVTDFQQRRGKPVS